MIKKLLIILLTCGSLFGSSQFTLDNIKNLKIHLINGTDFIDKKQQETLKQFIVQKLEKAKFIFGKVDSINFVVKIKSVEINNVHAITVFVGLAEDVITKRTGNIETYAFTYTADTFMESEDPYEDTLEAIDFLTCQFLTAYRDDNE